MMPWQLIVSAAQGPFCRLGGVWVGDAASPVWKIFETVGGRQTRMLGILCHKYPLKRSNKRIVIRRIVLRRSRLFGQLPGKNKLKAGSRLLG